MRDAFAVAIHKGYCVEREYVGLKNPVLWGTHYYGLTPEPWHFTAIMVRP